MSILLINAKQFFVGTFHRNNCWQVHTFVCMLKTTTKQTTDGCTFVRNYKLSSRVILVCCCNSVKRYLRSGVAWKPNAELMQWSWSAYSTVKQLKLNKNPKITESRKRKMRKYSENAEQHTYRIDWKHRRASEISQRNLILQDLVNKSQFNLSRITQIENSKTVFKLQRTYDDKNNKETKWTCERNKSPYELK